MRKIPLLFIQTSSMNFAYLDARSLLESLAPRPQEHVTPIPYELDPEWIEFEKSLSNFKTKFAQARVEAVEKLAELGEKKEEIGVVRMMLDNVSSQALKETLTEVLDNYETEEGISALSQQCGEAAGKVEAMKKVLMDTAAERYGKFTCFVCMDRLVDLFIDPCGHVICERCWAQTRSKTACPGCRQAVHGARKIYTI